MGKKYFSDRPSILSVLDNAKPSGAKYYRLLDSENRAFPPLEQPGFLVDPRIDVPSAPPGVYAIRFETVEGTFVPALGDDANPQVEIGKSGQVTASPVDLDVRAALAYQKVEKRENKYIREGLINQTLSQAFELLIESQKQVRESHQVIIGMTSTFTDGQKLLLEQQNRLFEAQKDYQPPQRDDWPGAAKVFFQAVSDVAKTGINAAAAERLARSADKIREALPKEGTPKAKLPTDAAKVEATPPLASEAAPKAEPTPTHAAVPAPAVSTDAATAAEPAAAPAKAETAPPIPSAEVQKRTSPKSHDISATREAAQQEEEEEEAPALITFSFRAAWREIQRRIVGITGEGIGFILSSPENFADFFQYLAEACPRVEPSPVEVPA